MSSPEGSFAGSDPFRHALRRYIAEAPSGFVAHGATGSNDWTPTVSFPGALSCRGGGPSDSPFIECVLFSSTVRGEANARFAEIVERVRSVTPGWKIEDLSQFDLARTFFSNGPTGSQTTATVDVAIVQLGENYNVNLVVQTWT